MDNTWREKNAINQGKGNLDVFANRKYNLVSTILNERWKHKRPNIGSIVCLTGGDGDM